MNAKFIAQNLDAVEFGEGIIAEAVIPNPQLMVTCNKEVLIERCNNNSNKQ